MASTPSNLTIGFQSAGLGVGTYTGSITVTPTTAGISPVTIPVTLIVTTSTTASVTPQMLTFTQSFGGPAPATQTIQLASTTAGLSFGAIPSTYSGGSW